MNRQQAETILTTHLHTIFGFALKRCKNIHDAEDLSQEIFYTNGHFLQRCLQELVDNGKLMVPPEEQKQSLSTVLISE